MTLILSKYLSHRHGNNSTGKVNNKREKHTNVWNELFTCFWSLYIIAWNLLDIKLSKMKNKAKRGLTSKIPNILFPYTKEGMLNPVTV